MLLDKCGNLLLSDNFESRQVVSKTVRFVVLLCLLLVDSDRFASGKQKHSISSIRVHCRSVMYRSSIRGARLQLTHLMEWLINHWPFMVRANQPSAFRLQTDG